MSSIHKMKREYLIRPIQSQSENQYDVTTFFDTNFSQEKHHLKSRTSLSVHTPLKQPKYRKNSKSQKDYRNSIKMKNLLRKISTLSFTMKRNLPQQCYSLNFKSKQQFARQLQQKLDNLIESEGKGRALFIIGDRQIGKKYILFQCLERMKSREDNIKTYYFDLSMATYDDSKKKWRMLLDLVSLMRDRPLDVGRQAKSRNGESEADERECTTHTFVIINKGSAFVNEISERTKVQLNKMVNKQSLSFIFIDQRLHFDAFRSICNHYQTLRCPNNQHTFYTDNLCTAINQYTYKAQKWIISRPIANYLSRQLHNKAQLMLSIVPNLIHFLQHKAQKTLLPQNQARQVNGEVLQQFMQVVMGEKIVLSISHLNIHEKCGLIACYISLKQTQQLLVQRGKLYSNYMWICKSLSMSAKEQGEFMKHILGQLLTYKIMRLHRGKGTTTDKDILCLVDLDDIRNAYQDDFLLSKFFTTKQSSWLQDIW